MTIHAGKWRIRLAARLSGAGGFWFRRDRFTEGDVYRVNCWLLFLKALVDCQTEHQRTMAQQEARQRIAEWVQP